MPSVKVARKSTDFDMTPFVDVAFLILSFFMLATKFKPPEKVAVTTPKSVSADKLKEQDAVQITFDSSGRVFFTMTTKKGSNKVPFLSDLLDGIGTARGLSFTTKEKEAFYGTPIVGVPFNQLKQVLDGAKVKEIGIPVDTVNNELTQWVATANDVFRKHQADLSDKQPNYMIKGDNNAVYPSFKGVIDAFRKNEVFNFQLITDPRSVPYGTALYQERNK